ncbi:MAG: mechanosensitive ion channel family protein [Acidobacteria bacterium]|nr:mechanosensitive ion channel family protein [Acidobacteriota bacterium]
MKDLIEELDLANWAEIIVGLAIVAVAALVSYLVVGRLIAPVVRRLVLKTEEGWDDILLDNAVLRRVALFAPAIVVLAGVPQIPSLASGWMEFIERVSGAVLILFIVLAFSALMTAAANLYATLPIAADHPINVYVQIARIALFVVGGVVIVARLADQSPFFFLTSIGALMAVILLIFRDTILSFVASLQLASNDMVRVGDWIEMPQFNADGDVIDMALHTVKVQNWDKTITTIPTHKLISESFKNWRGMSESGGRRVKRAIHIDMSSVRFLTDEEIAFFRSFAPLREYMDRKLEELDAHAADHVVEPGLTSDPRRLTNIGTLRAYIVSYLKQHPDLDTEGMTFLVRQLKPGSQGLPIEIYAFSSDTRWSAYEDIQADIFDHILAMIPEFGLRAFQAPSGADVRVIAGTDSADDGETDSAASPAWPRRHRPSG